MCEQPLDQLAALAAGLAGEAAEELSVVGVCRHGDNLQPQRLMDCRLAPVSTTNTPH